MYSKLTLDKKIFSVLLLLIFGSITSLFAQDANTVLNHWNVIAVNDLNYVSEIEGRTFVGQDYSMNNPHQYGFKLTGNSSSDIVLAIKGNVITNGMSNIKVFNGSAAVGSSVSNNSWFEFHNGGSLQENSSWPINNDPTSYVLDAADYLKTLSSNSSVQVPTGQPGPLKFNCATGEEVAIFDITDSDLFENYKVQQLELIPDAATKTVIINVESVDGKVDFNQGNMVGNFNNAYWRSRVIFNVYTNVNNGDMDYFNADRNMNGVLLAPTATVTGNSNYDGTVVCETLNNNSEVHYYGWNGEIPDEIVECKNTLGDKVWHDADVDGIQDAGEEGIEGVVVVLSGDANATATTDINGNYEFTNLPNGTYTVELAASNFEVGGVLNSTDSQKWHYTKRNQGDDTKDSDADKNNSSVTVTLDCADNPTIDFGFYKTCVSLIKEADKTEATVGDVISYSFTVTNCGDVKLGGGVDVYDEMLKPGAKLFYTTLNPGESKTFTEYSNFKFQYTVKEGDCDTELINTARAEGHPVDGSAYLNAYASATVMIKCTVECKNTIGDKVWHDADVDGIQDAGEEGIEGVVVVLSGDASATTTTNANGFYQFTDLANGTYYVELAASNFVQGGALYSTAKTKWFYTKINQGDDTKDSDANANNPKVAVTLDCNNNPTIDFGFYKTCVNLIKEADKTEAAVGEEISYSFTVSNCGDVKLGGGVDVYDEMLKPGAKLFYTTLLPGESKTFTEYQGFQFKYTVKEAECGTALKNIARAEGHPVDGSGNVEDYAEFTVNIDDCAPTCTGEIGDYVFVDMSGDCNGTQAGSLPIEGAIIELKYSNVTLLDTTDEFGKYKFTELCAGAYQVKIISLPSEYSEHTLNTPNQYSITLATDDQSNLTADFGYCAPPSSCTGKIGDYVFVDMSGNCDGTQVGSTPIAGAIIQLSYGGKRLTATTDAQGHYYFNDLCADDYVVTIVSLPAEYDEYTINTASTYNITLTGDGEENLDADFGYCAPAPPVETDLRIEKSVNDDNPVDGDVITYTITIYNDGDIEAGDVEVADLLPTGATYQSHTASQGFYYPLIGSWEVGVLASSASAELTISALVEVDDVYTTSWDLGPAIGYNLFVLQDIDQPSADTEGKVAVGGNARFANYSVGDKLQNSNGSEDVLVVGNNLTYTSGAVYNGNVVFGNGTNLPISQVSITGGSLKNESPIDFVAAGNYLRALSTDLSALDTTASATFQWGGFTLNGNDPYLNVFEIKGSDLSTANNMAINVPNGSVVLVNITGTDISWSGGLSVNGINETKVLYNFPNATNLTIQGIDVRGTVLAPRAKLNFVSGVVNGQVIAKFVEGMGQFNNKLFTGHIAGNTCVVNIAEITNSNVIDPNSSNNSDMATFCVGNGNSGGSGQNPGSSDPGNDWEYTSSFGIQEIIWSFTYDADGNIYAGTYGGKIYQSTDGGANWTQINTSMTVAVIWGLTSYDGYIFAATEQGLYRYDGSNWTLVGLSGMDVRTITVDLDGNLYAGTYGFGVYKSTDLGITWNAINEGLGYNLVIQSITVTSLNEIIVSTVGGGIAVSANGGVSWEMTNTAINMAWTLDVTSDGIVYAGTYGTGLHVSLDGGYTWESADLGVGVEFIYSISIDVDDNIYVSSLNSGVYVSYDGGVNWENLGLGGFGISSIFVNTYTGSSNAAAKRASGTTLLAGTKTGEVYTKVVSSITDVDNEENALPTEFDLGQNYPNPFNPTTQIEFSIPEAGDYSLRVFNAIGQEVAKLVNGQMTAGKYTVSFDAKQLASGMYIYQLYGNNVRLTKKMMLMK